jgi:hypothetical protein
MQWGGRVMEITGYAYYFTVGGWKKEVVYGSSLTHFVHCSHSKVPETIGIAVLVGIEVGKTYFKKIVRRNGIRVI